MRTPAGALARWARDLLDAPVRPLARPARRAPHRAARGLRGPAGEGAQARPHPRQAGSRPARPVRGDARAADRSPGPLRHRRPQLRRPRGPHRDARDLRRPARRRRRAGGRRGQLQPDDDVPGRHLAALARRPGLAAAVVAGGEGQVRLPGAGLRPALHDAGRARHRDGDRADARRRPGRAGGARAGRGRPVGQGHVAGADVREPDRRRHARPRSPRR